MAFSPIEPVVIPQAIAETSTTKLLPLGSTCRAIDPTYGEGEFIYLQGVASTAVGDAVVWDSSFVTTRTVAASRGAVGIAMSANVASQYGWYQIRGLAVVKVGTVAANAACQTTATDGTIDDTTTAGQFVDGMVTRTANGTPSAGLAVCVLAHPTATGR